MPLFLSCYASNTKCNSDGEIQDSFSYTVKTLLEEDQDAKGFYKTCCTGIISMCGDFSCYEKLYKYHWSTGNRQMLKLCPSQVGLHVALFV